MNTLVEFWSLLSYLILQGFGLVLAGVAASIFLYVVLRKHHSLRDTLLLGAFFVGAMLFFWFPVGVPQHLQFPFGVQTYGPAEGPALSLESILGFFRNLDNFKRVKDIAR